MIDDINILKLASAMARHAADRHQLLAQNVANADTPDYKAKDLESFSAAYSRLSEQVYERSPSSNGSGQAPWRTKIMETPAVSSPNGNTVSIEEQMMRAAEAQQHFDAATTIYKKMADILRMSLGRGV